MMLRKIFPMLVILVLPVLAEHPSSLLAQTAPMPAAMPTAATSGLAVGVPKLPPIATPRNQQVIPVPEQPAPDLNTPSSQTAPFEHGASVLSLPGTFARQISPTERVAPESIISQSYLGTRDDTVRGLSLKEAIYIGLANNPNVKVAELESAGQRGGGRSGQRGVRSGVDGRGRHHQERGAGHLAVPGQPAAGHSPTSCMTGTSGSTRCPH